MILKERVSRVLLVIIVKGAVANPKFVSDNIQNICSICDSIFIDVLKVGRNT